MLLKLKPKAIMTEIRFINYSKDYNHNKRIVVTKEKSEELYELYEAMVLNGDGVCVSLNETSIAFNGEIVQDKCIKYKSNFR